MGSSITAKADGSYIIELISPIGPNGSITEVVIAPFELDHPIRWGQGEFPSTLSLMSEMTGLSESMLRTLKYPDTDRVMIMFGLSAPATIRSDIEAGKKPMATPRQKVEPGQPLNPNQEFEADPIDPRFPAANGPVERFDPSKMPADDTGMSTAPKGRVSRVG